MMRNIKIILGLCLCLFGAKYSYAQSTEAILEEANKQIEQDNYALAQETFLQALKQAEKEKNAEHILKAQRGIAWSHYYMRDKSTAIKWLHTALRTIGKNKDTEKFLSNVYYTMSVMYIELAVIDSAEYYSNQAVERFKVEKNYNSLSKCYATLADMYLNNSKDVPKIKATIQKADYYANMTQNIENLAFVNMKWYFFYAWFENDYQTALQHINKAEKYAYQTGDKQSIMYAIRFKSECLAMLGDTLAVSYMRKWSDWKDSVFNIEKATNMAKYEKLYETEKKEIENKLLHEKNEQNRLILLIVIIAFLLFVAVALWLFNRNNLRKKQHELQMLQNLQDDKERIARDLHDNVGGQLSYIIYSLDGINDEDSEKRHEVTDSINQSVKSVIGSLRETIWAISDANISIQDFSDKLKVFAKNMFKHSKTKINFTENIKTERELNALLGLNLYRICQEILNNAFKYANADEVKINVQCKKEKLFITIHDNGIGFDVTQKCNEHYGLQNIKKRADEFGISLSLETEIGKGTRYALKV